MEDIITRHFIIVTKTNFALQLVPVETTQWFEHLPALLSYSKDIVIPYEEHTAHYFTEWIPRIYRSPDGSNPKQYWLNESAKEIPVQQENGQIHGSCVFVAGWIIHPVTKTKSYHFVLVQNKHNTKRPAGTTTGTSDLNELHEITALREVSEELGTPLETSTNNLISLGSWTKAKASDMNRIVVGMKDVTQITELYFLWDPKLLQQIITSHKIADIKTEYNDVIFDGSWDETSRIIFYEICDRILGGTLESYGRQLHDFHLSMYKQIFSIIKKQYPELFENFVHQPDNFEKRLEGMIIEVETKFLKDFIKTESFKNSL